MIMQLLARLLGRPRVERWLGLPPEEEREAMGLPSEAVQLVYLEGLGWVYQLKSDQRQSIDKIIARHKSEANAQTYVEDSWR